MGKARHSLVVMLVGALLALPCTFGNAAGQSERRKRGDSAPAQTAAILLRNDDGRNIAPNSYPDSDQSQVIKELVRFQAPRRMRVKKLRLIGGGGPGRLTIHVWRDIDSSVVDYVPFDGFEFDMVTPITINVESEALGRWVDIDLEARGSAFDLEAGMRVFVGAKVSPEGLRFGCDRSLDSRSSSIVEMARPELLTEGRSLLYEPSGDFMVRVEGTELADDPAPRFAEVTRLVGLPRIAASAFAWGDVDGDGWEDLLVNGERLFINDRGQRFREMPAGSLGGVPRSFGLFADVDGDGDLDLFTAGKGRAYGDSILLNDGSGRFERSQSGVPSENAYACAASWLDVNGDGLIDLFVANGTVRGDMGPADGDALYLNRGGGRFETVSERFVPGFGAFTTVATSGDLNGDGRAELFAGTYRLEPDRLLDLSAWPPTDIAAAAGVSGGPTPLGRPGFGHALGANMADLDADGDLDLLVTNLIHPDWRGLAASNESYLFENRGGGAFRRTLLRELGINFEETISDPTIEDFDNDGRLGLFHNSWYHTANLYEWRNGAFEDLTSASGLKASRAIASAAADFDRDGLIDLIVADREAGMKLYRNVSPARRWIGIKLEGTHCSRDGIGAIARIATPEGVLTRAVTSGKGNGNQDSLILHFGMDRTGTPVSVDVSWACGAKQTAGPLAPGKIYTVRELPFIGD